MLKHLLFLCGAMAQVLHILHILMQMLTIEAAQAKIINKDFTSLGTVLSLLSAFALKYAEFFSTEF